VHHDQVVFLLSLAVLLGVARILGGLCQRVKIPAVVGELCAGVLLGKTLLGRVAPGAYAWLFPSGTPQTLLGGYATIAAVLLLVVAGLEIDLRVVRQAGRVVVTTSLFGIAVPFALGAGLGTLLPEAALADPTRRGLHTAFLGIALSISALPVIARTLLDLGLMKTDLGLIILSAAVIDDLLGWTGFSVLSGQMHSAHGGVVPVLRSLALTLAFVAVVLTVVRPIVDRLFARMDAAEDALNGRILALMMVAALIGAATTDALGMHPVFGGFVVGVAAGQSRHLREHTRQILSAGVTSVFTPVFFATMALRYDFWAAIDPPLIIAIFLVACVAKIAGCALGARLCKVGWREAFSLGFGLNSRGAMEILLARLALEAGIINIRVFAALIIMAVGTSLMSGPALSRLLRGAPSPIATLLRAGVIELAPHATSREALITDLARALAARAGHADLGDVWAERVLARERGAGTGVGDGIALPHAEVEGIDRPLLAFARIPGGIDFDAPDGEPARLVFLALQPPRQYADALKLLSNLARLLTKVDVRRGLAEAASPEAVLATIDHADSAPMASLKTIERTA
jgi:Kef-type K+ transport system membrane component KefB/mannitol/fructose-specific phosphotransferase system IIA component (Ntr-type)